MIMDWIAKKNTAYNSDGIVSKVFLLEGFYVSCTPRHRHFGWFCENSTNEDEKKKKKHEQSEQNNITGRKFLIIRATIYRRRTIPQQ